PARRCLIVIPSTDGDEPRWARRPRLPAKGRTRAPGSGAGPSALGRGDRLSSASPSFTFADGLTVGRLGYGAMRLCGQPGNFGPYPDWDAGVRLVRHAVERGVRHLDTAG